MTRRRPTLARALAPLALAALALPGLARAQSYNPILLPGGNIPQFAQPLPVLDIWKASHGGAIPGSRYSAYPVIDTIVAPDPTVATTIKMCEFTSSVLPPLAVGARHRRQIAAASRHEAVRKPGKGRSLHLIDRHTEGGRRVDADRGQG